VTYAGRLIIALLVTPMVVHAQVLFPTNSASVHDQDQSFLDRPYTIMDLAVDALRDDAKRSADRVSSTRHYSNELAETKYGIFTTSGAYRDTKSESVNVWIELGIDHIIGEPAAVCSSELQLLSNLIFGSGKDIFGMDMREKKMLMRFGSEVTSDSLGAFAAAKALLLRTKFLLRLTGSGSQSSVSCWQEVATGIVHAGELPDER
jgi:hypothetical protein